MSAAALDALLIAAGGLLAALGGSPLIKRLFRHIGRRSSRGGGQQTLGLTAPGLLPGGQWIGYLERLAIFAALIAGWKEGIAIVLAVKGLARYPELAATSSPAAERFIIGTFASVLFAASCAGVVAWLTGLTTW